MSEQEFFLGSDGIYRHDALVSQMRLVQLLNEGADLRAQNTALDAERTGYRLRCEQAERERDELKKWNSDTAKENHRLIMRNAQLRRVAEAAKALKEQVETVFVVNPHEHIEGLGQIDALLAKFDAALADWERSREVNHAPEEMPTGR